MTNRICINCGSGRVHRAHGKNWRDLSILLLGGRTCRRHECNARFARFGGSLVRIADVHRRAAPFDRFGDDERGGRNPRCYRLLHPHGAVQSHRVHAFNEFALSLFREAGAEA